jgi:hypothetical protein
VFGFTCGSASSRVTRERVILLVGGHSMLLGVYPVVGIILLIGADPQVRQ